MDPLLAPYAARAAPRLDAAAFLAAIEERRGRFDGLLDDEALALLVLDELGLNEEAFVPLSGTRGRAEASVRAEVAGPPTRRAFTRRDGGTGEVTNLPLSDASGRATLVLWDRDGEKVAGLRAGTPLRVIHARVKESKFGLELHASPWTVIEVPGALSAAKAKLLADVAAEAPADALTGELVRVEPTRTYLREDGGVGFAADIVLRVGGAERRVTCHNEAVRAIRAVAAGATVTLTALAPDAGGVRTTDATRIS